MAFIPVSLLDTPERYAKAAPGICRDGFNTVALVVVCQIAHFLTFAAIPLLLPAIRDDLGLTFTQAGVLAGAAMVSYSAGQVPAGLISDRYGPRRPYLAGLLAWSILSIGFGLVHAFWLAVAIQFVAGAFRALLFAPGLSLLADWFPPQRRATAMSLFMLGGAAGSVLLSLAAPPLVERHGWRATFMLFAALGLAAAWAFSTWARDRPAEKSARPLDLRGLVQLARFPILWVCSWLQFVRFVVAMGFNFWLPSFLVNDRGFSLATAGLVMALSAALSAPSNTLGAYVSDRLRNPPLVIGGALAVLACAAAALPLVESPPLLLAVVAVYSVFLGFYFGPLFLVPVEVLGTRVAGTTIGFSNLFANIGGFACVMALGTVRDAAGSFTPGFLGISAAGVVGVGLSFLLARMRGRALAAAPDGSRVERGVTRVPE